MSKDSEDKTARPLIQTTTSLVYQENLFSRLQREANFIMRSVILLVSLAVVFGLHSRGKKIKD